MGSDIHTILIIAEARMGIALTGCVRNQGYESTILESQGTVSNIVAELKRTKYALVIVTNTSITPSQIQTIVPAIKAQCSDIRIIVLSGSHNEHFVSDLRQKGIDGWMPLPFREDVLMNKVDQLLSLPAI